MPSPSPTHPPESSATETLEVPQGSFELSRWPDRQGPPLRAWDAADEYLLRHLWEEKIDLTGHVVVINDSFGALATALSSAVDLSWGDSLISHRALAANLERHDRSGPAPMPGPESPDTPVDVVLLKFPKHNALLEDQLHRLRPQMHTGTLVIGAGMVKNVHTSTLHLLEAIVGPTNTSLAKKKARLAFSSFDPDLRPATNPWPRNWKHGGLSVVNHGGVFSAQSIDIGTRFLLEHLPTQFSSKASMVDLGCGNGVVGATLLRANPAASCLFVDESYAAVESARQTVRLSAHHCDATFAVAENLDHVVEAGSIDLIVVNPPFHASTALSNAAAEDMFRASYRALRVGGELCVIGNRHLGHHIQLKRTFGACSVVAANAKFVIMATTRR